MSEVRLSEREVRIQKVAAMRELGVNPYADHFRKQDDIAAIVDRYAQGSEAVADLRDSEEIVAGPRMEVAIAGRVMLYRAHGKLAFGRVMDGTGQIQVMFHKSHCQLTVKRPGEDAVAVATVGDMSVFKFIEKFVDRGDFVGVQGEVFRTHKGELTVFVSALTFLSKSLRGLPDKFHGLKDHEMRYRQRYLDMTMNEESYAIFVMKSKIVRALREFYWSQGFVEIETSVLGNFASGTAAAPFSTHHNAYDMDVYLRVATETQNKMATAGRFEKVFEIGKDFRNEGIDPSHLQEFTQCEHYAAYRSYEENMVFTEQLFDYLFEQLSVSKIRKVINKQGVEKAVDFTTPWERIDYIERIKKDCGIDVSVYTDEDEQELRRVIRENGHDWAGLDIQATATMIDYLYKKVTRPKIVGPAFIYNYPKTMQPLARVSDDDAGIVEQFQLVINGVEILKSYSELVDPLMQQANFDVQADALERGDDEATAADDDFVAAMEYGMPPQSGRGMGIERLCAVLLEQTNLRDVTMFPLMKPEMGESMGKSKDTMLAVALVNKGAGLLPWQEMNTIAHLNAAYGARMGKGLFMQDSVETADGMKIKLNTQHAIMIKEIEDHAAVRALLSQVDEAGCEVAEFTREMLETSDDVKVAAMTKEKTHSEIEYYGVLVYGKKKVVEKLTKEYGLYESNSCKEVPASAGMTDSGSLVGGCENEGTLPSVADAEALATKYLVDTHRHCQEVGDVMRWFARKLGKSEEEQERWYITGLLHDVDWDHINKDMHSHLGEQFLAIMEEVHAPHSLIMDIRSHYTEKGYAPIDSEIRKYLAAVDELSGFLYAYSLMREDGYANMKWKSINKKLKDKKFAAGVSREHVRYCEEYLGIPLSEFVLDVAKALEETQQH